LVERTSSLVEDNEDTEDRHAAGRKATDAWGKQRIEEHGVEGANEMGHH
jgi:hypothetical protein